MSEHTPGYGAYYEVVREINRLRVINAELLAALEDLADLHDGDDPVGYARDVARAAIARAKGETP